VGIGPWARASIIQKYSQKLKKYIKNHDVNENKMLKPPNFQKNKLYKIAIFNFFTKTLN
jgi:hypothetical protein